MSAAPMKPALGPSAAWTISGSVRWPRPVRERENAVRVGPISSSPASESPPPMMMQPGSNAAAMPARPTPSQRPTSASSSMESGSPSRAAWVIWGPSSRAASPPTIWRRWWAIGESARTISRASRTSALPDAYCSQQPRLPHSQRWPSGTTCMWPNSPAIPFAPR